MTDRLRIALLLVLALAPLLAGGTGNRTHPSLIVPRESGLTPSAVTPDPTEQASFSGQVWVEGSLRAQWSSEDSPDAGRLEVDIKLDDEERKHLPWYDWPEWKQTYIPGSVDILNPQDAVKLVFSEDVAAKFLGKKVLVAKVHGRFLLTGHETGVECDAPWAHAKLISSDVTAAAQLGNRPGMEGC